MFWALIKCTGQNAKRRDTKKRTQDQITAYDEGRKRCPWHQVHRLMLWGQRSHLELSVIEDLEIERLKSMNKVVNYDREVSHSSCTHRF